MGHLRYIECVSYVALTTVSLSRQHVTQPIDRDNSFPSSNSFGPNDDPDCTPNRRYDPLLESYQEYRLGSGETDGPFFPCTSHLTFMSASRATRKLRRRIPQFQFQIQGTETSKYLESGRRFGVLCRPVVREGISSLSATALRSLVSYSPPSL